MTVTATEFLAQLETAGISAISGAPESQVESTFTLMGSMGTSLIEDNFEMAQSKPQQELDAAPTTGFDLS